MEMKRVLLLAVLGHAASGIECSVESPCLDDGFICEADLTDRTGQRGYCTRPMQWAGDDCTYLIGDSAGFIDSCDASQGLICVSGELRGGYTCQPAVSVPYSGCLSTAASYMSQCASDMVCIAYPGSRQQGQCRLPTTVRGASCSALVISGPGYQADSCDDDFVCRDHQCVLVSVSQGSCNLSGDAASQVFCPEDHACDKNFCREQPAPVYCNSDMNCRSNQLCAEGVCKLETFDGTCNEDTQLPFAEQLYCPSGTFCLPDDVGTDHCQPDMCYGRCGAGTMCDNDIAACVEKEECATAAQDKCCVVSKVVNSAICPKALCVCEFDTHCCDNEWDFYCVTYAQKYCAVTC